MALVVKKVNGHGPAAAAAPAPAPESLAALQVKAAGVTVDALPYIDTEIDQPGIYHAPLFLSLLSDRGTALPPV